MAGQTTFKYIKVLVPILVQRFKAETKTATGIFLPISATTSPLPEAAVTVVGPGAPNNDGTIIPLHSKLAGRVSYGFRSLTATRLEHLDVEADPDRLILNQSNLPNLIAKSQSLGASKSEMWSSDGLYCHLNMLKGFVAKNEASARLWIDAFFFRVRTMLEQTEKSTVLGLERHVEVTVNPSTDLTGYVDYAALRGSKAIAGSFLQAPILNLRKNKESLSLFVTSKAKKGWMVLLRSFSLRLQVKCMHVVKKQIVCGALTDGQNWIFLLLIATETGGGQYYSTDRIRLIGLDGNVSKQQCDIVAGIMAHWIDNSHQDLDANDWVTHAND